MPARANGAIAMVRKVIVAGTMILLLAGPLTAQSINMLPTQAPRKSTEEIQKELQVESAYQAAIHKIPEQKKPVDPWGKVRQAPQAAGSAKQPRQ
jgi:hypothetical protein